MATYTCEIWLQRSGAGVTGSIKRSGSNGKKLHRAVLAELREWLPGKHVAALVYTKHNQGKNNARLTEIDQSGVVSHKRGEGYTYR